MSIAKIVPSEGRIAVDCKVCGAKKFEVHVRVVQPDARIEELACSHCGTYYKTEYGLIRGKANAHEKRGVDIAVPTHAYNMRTN